MSDPRALLQQALEALTTPDESGCDQWRKDVITALRKALEQPEHPRRLTDDEIGQIWFAAKIPGLNESDARRLIRAAEAAK